jgi:hypothetical protein
MASSDYTQYRKISNILKVGKLRPILYPSSYTQFFEYSLENQVANTKQVNSQLTLPSKTIIYDMEIINVGTCPPFLICQNTNLRPNRVPNSGVEIQPRPPRPLTVKQLAKPITALPICQCTDEMLNT